MNREEFQAEVEAIANRPLSYRLEGHEPVPIANNDDLVLWYTQRWPQSQVAVNRGRGGDSRPSL